MAPGLDSLSPAVRAGPRDASLGPLDPIYSIGVDLTPHAAPVALGAGAAFGTVSPELPAFATPDPVEGAHFALAALVMGQVMAALKRDFTGRYDGRIASEIAKAALAG